MRLGMVTQDTRGGVQPYAALASALIARGHEVRAVAPHDLAWLFERVGAATLPLAGPDAATVRAIALEAQGARMGGLREAGRAVLERVPGWAAQARQHLAGVDAVLGGIGGSSIGRPVATALGVPWIAAELQPIAAPSRAYPAPLLAALPAGPGGVLNLVGGAIGDVAIAALLRAPRAAAMRALGVRRLAPADRGALYGISPHVVPLRSGAGGERVATGYWFLPEPEGSLAEPVVAFLDEGPTVVAGFGSMAAGDPWALRRTVERAAAAAGARLLLIDPATAHEPGDGRAVLAVGAVPHGLVLPRAAASVHHGGAGTTAAALAAGVPTVIVPFGAEQPFWARRARELGVAPPAPRASALTAEVLGEAMAAALRDQGMRERAAALGRRIRAEDGTGAAARWLEHRLGAGR